MIPRELGFNHEVDHDGVLHVVFDRPETKVNLLDADLLESLGALLSEVRSRDDVRAVLFYSSKPGMFIAGMDVEQIADVDDTYRAAEGARFGQAVFQQIADLRKPTACAIHGTCLGGGTELALACDFRLAADDGALRIGLPEVKIGIVPGFGGCQRLPRLIGATGALDMILTGRNVDGKSAKRRGIVDLVVPSAYLVREAHKLLLRALESGVDPVARKLRRPWSLVDRLAPRIPPLRNYILDQARKKTGKRVSPRDYPAPFRAIEAVDAALTQPLQQGLDFEARIIGELVPTQTSKNLIWLFKNNTAIRSDASVSTAPPRKVRRAAVIGAGLMGGGIAQLVAEKDLPVRMKDLRYDAVLTALQTAASVWERKVRRRRMTRREFNHKMAYIAPTLDDSGLVHTDIVLEAVVENLDVKQKVLAQVERHIDERTVFASNTSSLPIGEIAARALRPERVVGLHFFNPVHRMPLVEVIASKVSSPEAVATAHALARRLGKTPVVVKDSPGFLVNRILTCYLNEAMMLFREGARIESIDPAMTGFGMPMGPFELMDQIGLDTAQHVAGVIGAAFGERMGGDDTVIRTMVSTGRHGQKSGKGFYRYRGGKRGTVDTDVYELLGVNKTLDIPQETMQERMVLAMINEAVLCLEERVARSPRDLDMAMVMGTGFPPFRGGLLRHADSVGIPIVADRLSRLADAHGARFRPAAGLQEMVRGQQRFYG